MEIKLTPEQEATIAAYAHLFREDRKGENFKAALDAVLKAAVAAGLRAGFSAPGAQTLRSATLPTIGLVPLVVATDGGLWAFVYQPGQYVAPALWAPAGQMEDPRPILPAELVAGLVPVYLFDDSSLASAELGEVWGDPEERRAARTALIEAINRLE